MGAQGHGWQDGDALKILNQYVGSAVVGSTLLVVFILLALFSFASFVSELEDVGKGGYDLLQAGEYVVLSLPRMAYELFPVSALLGSMVGLGMMASNNELVVMRAAGVSMWQIVMSVMQAGLILMILAVVLGEVIAPESEQYAQTIRSKALSQQTAFKTKNGFWTRDGLRFINVRAILPGGELSRVNIYEFDDQRRLREATSARSASYRNDAWVLKDVKQSIISANQVTTHQLPTMVTSFLMNHDVLEVITIKPKSLSAWGLYKYVNYLNDNELNASSYEMVLWSKIVLPFSTGVMVFLSIPFVFGSLRSVGVGQRILIGTLIGIGFYIFNQIFSYVGLVYKVNPAVSAIIPTIIFFALGMRMLRRVY
jgi:lipopolysaccharide export system permease protein